VIVVGKLTFNRSFLWKIHRQIFKPGKVSKKLIQVSKYQKADCFSFLVEIATSKYTPTSLFFVEIFPEFICLYGAMKRKKYSQKKLLNIGIPSWNNLVNTRRFFRHQHFKRTYPIHSSIISSSGREIQMAQPVAKWIFYVSLRSLSSNQSNSHMLWQIVILINLSSKPKNW